MRADVTDAPAVIDITQLPVSTDIDPAKIQVEDAPVPDVAPRPEPR